MPTYEGKTIELAITAGLVALQLPRDAVQVTVLAEAKRGFFGLGAKPARVQVEAAVAKAPEVAAEKVAPKLGATAAAKSAGDETELTAVAVPAGTDAAANNDILTPDAQATAARRAERQRINDAALDATEEYVAAAVAALGIKATISRQHISGGVLLQIDADKEALLIGKHGKTINSLQFLAQTLFNHRGRSKWQVMLNVSDYRQRRDLSVRRLAERTAREVLASGKTIYLDPMPSFERKAIHQQLQGNRYATTRSEGKEPHRYVVVVPKR